MDAMPALPSPDCTQHVSSSDPDLKDDLAASVANEVRAVAGADSEVWAVTHSMGGIVLRHIMGLPDCGGVRWRGCCMIAPPNRGSAVARRLRRAGFPVGGIFGTCYGQAGQQLGVEVAQGDAWPAPPQPCGVIAGPHDGTVSVEEAKTAAMTDLVLVNKPHATIMYSDAVGALVVSFLRHGSFVDK